MSKTYGYARVSSKEQHLDRQILRLQEYVEKDQIIVDKPGQHWKDRDIRH